MENQPPSAPSKIVLSGGGSLGPVTPLLALAEAWRVRDPGVEFVWVGTPHGPEREVVTRAGIRFLELPVARLPRYISVEGALLPLRLGQAFARAAMILQEEKPNMVISAGGYTAVPLVIAGWFSRVPSWIHQQDVTTLLSNRLCAPFASLITVAWERSLPHFSKTKTTWIGNPVRPSVLRGSRARALAAFGLADRPTVLVLGGGGGASWLNKAMREIGPSLIERANVIHLTGVGKLDERLKSIGGGYVARELLVEEMSDVLVAADLVVCRAGMATITELAALQKPAILVPLPDSPQEANAAALDDAHAAVVLSQAFADAARLNQAIISLLDDGKERERLGAAIHHLLPTNVADNMVDEARRLLQK